MRILLVRHGKTKGNLERRYVGRTDEPLLTEEAFRLQSSPYREFAPDVVYTSRLLRCRQTAEILFPACDFEAEIENVWRCEGYLKSLKTENAGSGNEFFAYENAGVPYPLHAECEERAVIRTEKCGIPLIVHAGLNETDFGDFEYYNYEELNGNPAYQAWLDSGGTAAFPGGESGAAFRKRARTAFLECVHDARKRNAHRAAFVVHGGTIMAVMEAFARPRRDFYDWQLANGEGFLTELKTAVHSGLYLDAEGKAAMSGELYFGS